MSSCHHVIMSTNFGNFCPFSYTFGHFHELLATLVIFWPLLSLFGNLWQLLPMLAIFGNPWQLLAPHVTISSSHIFILSSCHHVLFSSGSLMACKFVSLSIHQLVNLFACKLVSFSACASWSLFLWSSVTTPPSFFRERSLNLHFLT